MYNPTADSKPALNFFLMAGYAMLAVAVQVTRVSPSPVGDASQMFRHNAYVDSKVRQVIVNFLNHQAYHQRNVVFPSSASIFPSFASNFTKATALFSDAGIQLQPTSTVPIFTPLHFPMNMSTSTSTPTSDVSSMLQPALNSPLSNLSVTAFSTGQASSSLQMLLPSYVASASFSGSVSNATIGGPTGLTVTASRYNSSVATGIGNLTPPAVASSYLSRYRVGDSLHLTTNLSLSANVDSSWENDTDNACFTQLNTLNGIPTNPSGVSACYNIRSLDNSTGDFNADLRLYRIAAASGDWTQMRSDGVAIGMAYPDATVNLQKIARKRDLVDFQGPIMHVVGSQLTTRASNTLPKLLQTLSFLGQVHNSSVPELHVEAIALALVTPKINLAGTTRNGTTISNQLSLQDASFLNGLFVDSIPHKAVTPTMIIGSREWLSKANSFSAFPTSLVLVAVWSLLFFAMDGYELLEKLKCRNEDERRMLAGSSGGTMEK